MSDSREERDRKKPGLFDALLLGTVAAGTIYFATKAHEQNVELADELLEVNGKETDEHFKRKLNGGAGGPLDDKLRSIPKALKGQAILNCVDKLASDPMWKYILRASVDANLEWMLSSNMDSTAKQDKKAEVASVAWKSSYQCLLTRRQRADDSPDPLDVVATFALIHGANIDPFFQRKDSVTGLSPEANTRLEAVGKFLNDIKLKHFFNRKPGCVELVRFTVKSDFTGKGVENAVVEQILAKTQLPVLIVVTRPAERDLYVDLGFELLEEAEFPGVQAGETPTFRCWFLVKRP